jgi:dynactin complex subunit
MSASRQSLAPKLEVGSRVVTGVAGTKKGEIKFIGDTQFSTGEWIGIALDTPEGKNDGSVAGVRYFECKPNHGLFLKRVRSSFF